MINLKTAKALSVTIPPWTGRTRSSNTHARQARRHDDSQLGRAGAGGGAESMSDLSGGIL
jgi:hypothetical protein